MLALPPTTSSILHSAPVQQGHVLSEDWLLHIEQIAMSSLFLIQILAAVRKGPLAMISSDIDLVQLSQRLLMLAHSINFVEEEVAEKLQGQHVVGRASPDIGAFSVAEFWEY